METENKQPAVSILNRIEVNAVELREALEVAVTEKKSTIPVLTQILLHPTADGIRVISTDLDMSALTDIGGKSDTDKSILIPFRKVFDLIKGENGPAVFSYLETVETVKRKKHGEYKDGQWTEGVEYEEELTSHNITLEVGAVAYELQALDATNFPVLPITDAPQFHIPGTAFKSILARTVFAISKEESRYTLNGMLLKAENNKIVFAATDGHRMAVEEFELPGVPKLLSIIATPALAWLQKHLGKIDVGVNVGEKDTVFSLPDIRTVFISRKVTGTFPNYEAVMPKREAVQHVATFPAGDGLAKVLTKVSQMADERSHAVKWSINGTCELSAQSSETGKALAKVQASIMHKKSTEESPIPDEVAIGLCTPYILDFLKVAGKNPVTISLKDSSSAALLEVPALQGYTYIVMPMRM